MSYDTRLKLKIVKPVMAIEINPDTFSKIEEQLKPDELDALKKWYEEMKAAGARELYFVTRRIFENGYEIPSMAMPRGIFLERFDWACTTTQEWFDVTPKSGMETLI